MLRVSLMTVAGFGLSAALWPLGALADPSTSSPPSDQTRAAAPSPAPQAAAEAAALAAYPAAAKAAGLEGSAVIHCERSQHVALRNCALVSETPAGSGFGAAALALAAKSPDNPKVDLADVARRPPINLEVRFRLHPPAITPNPADMAHLLTPPRVVSGPTRAQVEAAYPVRALADGVDGVGLIDCLVSLAGQLSSCQQISETPSGYGFGAAALELAADYKLTPRALDGDPIGGAEVQVPVRFQAVDPSAPLELGTTPAKP